MTRQYTDRQLRGFIAELEANLPYTAWGTAERREMEEDLRKMSATLRGRQAGRAAAKRNRTQWAWSNRH